MRVQECIQEPQRRFQMCAMPCVGDKRGVRVFTLQISKETIPAKKKKEKFVWVRPSHARKQENKKKRKVSGERHSHRSCNAVASPARKSVVPVCEARLTAQQPRCGNAVSADVLVVGSRSVLLSRMNVCGVTSGTSSAGISSRGPGGVAETASGNESTRSEASAASTLGNI